MWISIGSITFRFQFGTRDWEVRDVNEVRSYMDNANGRDKTRGKIMN